MSAEQVAGSILGQRCWVRWPYLQEALVDAVSDRHAKVCWSACALHVLSVLCCALCSAQSILLRPPCLATGQSQGLMLATLNVQFCQKQSVDQCLSLLRQKCQKVVALVMRAKVCLLLRGVKAICTHHAGKAISSAWGLLQPTIPWSC